MLLSVIVTNYKTSDLLKLCLESIVKAGAGLECEVMIVDSEAEDETREMIKESFPSQNFKWVLFEKNVGYAKLVNAGLSAVHGEFVLILNADMILFEDSLRKMVDFMLANPKVGLLGPQLLNFNGSIQESCFRFYRPLTILYRRTRLAKTKKGQADLARFLMKDFDRQSSRDVEWLLGAALLVRGRALREVGEMDERFFMYFEDVDWCRRFREAGWRVVYFPQAKMHHYHGQISKRSGGLADIFLNKYTWIHLQSAMKYFWKYRFRTEFEKS